MKRPKHGGSSTKTTWSLLLALSLGTTTRTTTLVHSFQPQPKFHPYSAEYKAVIATKTRSFPCWQLQAVSILPKTQRQGQDKESEKSSSRQQWRKGVIQRVFRRDRQKLQATATMALEEAKTTGTGTPTNDRPLLNYSYQESRLDTSWTPLQEKQAPLPIFLTVPNDKIVGAAETTLEQVATPTPLRQEGPLARTTRSVAESTLQSLLLRWCDGNATNMRIACEPKSNVVGLARGLFRCDATVDCDFIQFPCIQFSGGRLSTQRLTLNLYSFSALNVGHRFPHQFDFEATDVLFTANDLFASDCIRNGLARLLTRILRNRGMTASKVRTDLIEITRDGKLSFQGRVKTGLADVAFQVRTGLATASRGHVLTFPGLEASLSPALGIFFPVPDIAVDLGYSSQIRKLQLDPATGLQISCQTTVKPKHTLTTLLQYAQSTESYAAPFSIDVGRWLTRIGNFSA